ncbi:hypothetical protein [Reyranella sp.]|uniref:hypothetical protein n=1 Tax=Reyranella sp. TaxID=1929291 RepID=UPI003F729772
MPDDFIRWPTAVLKPAAIEPNVVPFSRSGGRTLGGLERSTRTDLGWWSIAYRGVTLAKPASRRMWNALAADLSGMATPVVVPVWSLDSAPWPAGTVNGRMLVPHSDGLTFSDGSLYSQPAIGVTLVNALAIGATQATLRIGFGIDELTGVLFSYGHALYKTGMPLAIDGADWTVRLAPAVRAPIPAGAALEFGLPTCLVRLASDREMDVMSSVGKVDKRDVAFVEDVAYWNDLASA